MKAALCLGIIVIISVLTRADSSEESPQKKIQKGLKFFGYRWSEELLKNAPNKNLISSSASAGMALAMLSLGAGGNTKAEIKTALKLPESEEITKSGMKHLTEGFENSETVNVKIANKVFTQEGFEVTRTFKESTSEVFHAEAQDIDFGKANEASKTINDWVESKTNHFIKNFMSPDQVRGNSMVLVNAIYFNGKWKKPFQSVEEKLFYMDDQTSKNVSTMHVEGRFQYGNIEGVNATYVVLPYQSDYSHEQYSMFIIVPNQIAGLKSIEENVKKINWTESLAHGQQRSLIIDMPKFKIESTIDCKEIFSKMGMNDMFGNSADFIGISDRPLKVSKAVQKAFIDVNESGSEAAAATGLGVMLMAMPMPVQKIHLKIDRPFLFTIMMKKDNVNMPLFSGRLVDPTYV